MSCATLRKDAQRQQPLKYFIYIRQESRVSLNLEHRSPTGSCDMGKHLVAR
jgi:hypothetical protein